MKWKLFSTLIFGLMVTGGPMLAQNSGNQPAILQNVTIEQKLNAQIPLDLPFRDETGAPVRFGDYFGEKPVVLALVYYECPMLCDLILNGLLKCLRVMPLDVGDDFEVVTVSFDPGETADLAAAKKANYLRQYDRPGAAAGWHFLTGDPESIRKLTEAVGFGYAYDPERDEFAHGSAIMVATPEGKLSHYFYGVEYSPKDVRLALIEASKGDIGSPVDQLLLYCYHYDPIEGKYGLVIMRVIRLAGLATVAILGTFLVVMFRRDRKAKARDSADEAAQRYH